MIRSASILFLCLLLAGCGDDQMGRNMAKEAEPEPARPSAEPNEDASDEEPLASVMRPSVVAEATPPSPPPPPPVPVKIVLLFETGAQLDDAARSALDTLVASPPAAAAGRIIIRGHSDSMGDDRQNRLASRKRAEAVRDYLVERGIADDRITLIALGETRPAAPNANLDGSDFEEGRRRNRRVEVEIQPSPADAEPDQQRTAVAPPAQSDGP